MAGKISIFRGFVGWASSIEELVRPDDSYAVSEILCWPAAQPSSINHKDTEGIGRAAVVQNLCQTASGGSYYCRVGADYTPFAGGLQLEMAVPLDDNTGLGDLAQPLWQELLALVGKEPVVSGRIRFHWARFHPVDSRLWAYRAAVRLLWFLFQPTTPWPPSQAQAEGMSKFFQRGLEDEVTR